MAKVFPTPSAIREATLRRLPELIQLGFSGRRIIEDMRSEFGRFYRISTFYEDYRKAKASIDLRQAWSQLDPNVKIPKYLFAPTTRSIGERRLYIVNVSYIDVFSREEREYRFGFTSSRILSKAEIERIGAERLRNLIEEEGEDYPQISNVLGATFVAAFEQLEPAGGKRARATTFRDAAE